MPKRQYTFFNEVEEETEEEVSNTSNTLPKASNTSNTLPKASNTHPPISLKNLSQSDLDVLLPLPGQFSDLISSFGVLQQQINQITTHHDNPIRNDLIQKIIEIGETSLETNRQYLAERYRLASMDKSQLDRSKPDERKLWKKIHNAQFQTKKITEALQIILDSYKLIPKT